MNIPKALRDLAKEVGFRNGQLNDYLDVVRLRAQFEASVKNVHDTFNFSRCQLPDNFNTRVAQIRQLFVTCLEEQTEIETITDLERKM